MVDVGTAAHLRLHQLTEHLLVEDLARCVAPALAYIVPGSPQPAEGSLPSVLGDETRHMSRILRPKATAAALWCHQPLEWMGEWFG